MIGVVLQYLFPDTQTELKLESGNLHLILGSIRESVEAKAKELEWLQDKFGELNQQLPNKLWGVLVNIKGVKVEQKNLVDWPGIFQYLLTSDKIRFIAVLEASRTFQVTIRKIMIKNTKETGKLKFFENKTLAEEWLKVKIINNK